MLKKALYISLAFNILGIILAGLAVHKVGGLNYLVFKVKNRGIGGIYQHRVEHLESIMATSNEIIFLGNSITAGAEWADLLQNPKAKNRGIPGDMTDGVLRRLPKIIAGHPKMIFLMIGVNDLAFRNQVEIIGNYKEIVKQITTSSPATRLYLQSVLPVNNKVNDTGLDNSMIQKLNQEIIAIAKSNNLLYIDLAKKLMDDSGDLDAKYTADGIHLNGAAYLAWKEVVDPYINNEALLNQ